MNYTFINVPTPKKKLPSHKGIEFESLASYLEQAEKLAQLIGTVHTDWTNLSMHIFVLEKFLESFKALQKHDVYTAYCFVILVMHVIWWRSQVALRVCIVICIFMV